MPKATKDAESPVVGEVGQLVSFSPAQIKMLEKAVERLKFKDLESLVAYLVEVAGKMAFPSVMLTDARTGETNYSPKNKYMAEK